MRKQLPWIISLLAFGILFPNCVKKAPLPPWTSKISMLQAPIGPEEIFRLPEGNQITFKELLKDLQTTRVIFVGESHDQIEHHRIQARLLQNLIAEGRELGIAMEMFTRSQQPVLDQWIRGLLTEEEFLKEVQWETTWGIDYELYRDILDQARTHRIKVLGLNIERDLVRRVAQNGIEKLSFEDRRKLPEMDLTDQRHRAYIKSIYKNHQGGVAEDFQYFYEAQSLWDDGMAETLSDYLKSSDGKGKTLLVLTGSGHVVFGFGIPDRFYRRTSLPYQTIVLKAWKEKLDEDFTFTETSSPLANFLWLTPFNAPVKRRPSIGVVLKKREDQKGLWIERVLPNSPAEKAGLFSGDHLIMVEGKEIVKGKDIHDAVVQKGSGNSIHFILFREGVKKEISIPLSSLKD